MLIFIDESGDSGFKIDKGSSAFFVVSLVIFENHEEALFCDIEIDKLKKELSWNKNSEFHFKNNSDKIREIFIKRVSDFNFYYGCIVIDKKNYFFSKTLHSKSLFYQQVYQLAFEQIKENLHKAIVLIDKNGGADFIDELKKSLKFVFNKNFANSIKKIKIQDSKKNNLLQLSDYVAGIINRSFNNKKSDYLRRIISRRELFVLVFPKTKNSDPIP